MTFTVFGTGGVGGYFGARLAESGQHVHFIIRSDYSIVKEKGLRVLSPKGDIYLPTPAVYKTPEETPPADVILVATKTTSNESLKRDLSSMIHKNTSVILLQNGLGMEEQVHSWFPDNAVLGGMCFIGSRKKEPGVIEHQASGTIQLSSLKSKDIPLREEISGIFEKAGVPITQTDSLKEARWYKLLWNIPYNGLCSVLNVDTLQIMESEPARNTIETLMDEVVKGANACGCNIESDKIEMMMKYTIKIGPYCPSMLLDFRAKRPMEIEYMYSNPVKTAASAGYEMKNTRMLMEQLKFIQSLYSVKKHA